MTITKPLIRLAYAGITTLLFALATHYFITRALLRNDAPGGRDTLLYGLAAAGTLSLMLRRGGSVIRLVRDRRRDVRA